MMLNYKSGTKRLLAAMATLAIGAAAGVVLSNGSPVGLAWIKLSRPERPPSTPVEPAVAKDTPAPSKAMVEAADGLIDMPPDRIEAQGIEIAPAGKGVLARELSVPGTITLDPGRLARVPGRVVGTVIEMRKRLGDTVTQGEVVAVLDSREVADAKSEYLTASVAYDLQRTLFERTQTLWAKRIAPEQRYLQAREAFLEAELRLNLARQKLSALNLDPAEVERAAKEESSASLGVSSLCRYEIRSLIAGRVVERKVDVGSLVGSQGDPSELYTIADLAVVWAELAVPTRDLDMAEEGQAVVIESGGESGKRAEGRIKFISPLVQHETHSVRAIAEIDNTALIWRPGAAVTARIMIEKKPMAVCVPRGALQSIGGEQVVFVRTQEGFQRRNVTTGSSDQECVEITAGLSAGEEIAVKNTFLLKAELGKGDVVGE